LFGVINALQYGHVLHETMMALFHTILTFSPAHSERAEEATEDGTPAPPKRNIVLISGL
jgi:hypothetical protein